MGISKFFRRRRWDDERADEMAAHLAHEIDDNLARGLSRDDARAAAYRKFGNVALRREEIYEMNSLGFAETLWQDLRYGARLLRRDRTFAAVAILTLALGTGANTAIFQLVNAVRLRTLPVERPDQLVEVRIDTHDKGRTGRFVSNRPFMTEPLLRRIEASQQAFSSLMAYSGRPFDLATGGESKPVDGMWVTGSFFPTLGVTARLGRVLTAGDDRPGCGSPGAVLSDAFWKRQYGADPGVLGRPITLDGQPFEIIGVTPPSFFGVEVGRTFDVAIPLCSEPLIAGEQSAIGRSDYWLLDIIGRLKPGWTPARADAHLTALSADIFHATVPGQFDPGDQRDYLAFTLVTRPAATGVSSLRADYESPLWILLGATALVLLIACANLANLLLARATARERELAVRLAIGASRRRVVRQMISESALIAILGAAAGLLVATWFSRMLVSFLSTDGNRIFVDLHTDWRVFAFTFAVAGGAALLFGLAPALRATRGALNATIRAGSRGMTDSRERFGLRRALVIVQVALSLVLVVGALLLGGTYRNLLTADRGFRASDVVVASLDLRRSGATPEGRPSLLSGIGERLRAIPGVDTVAQVFIVPVSGAGWNGRVVIGGQQQPGNTNRNLVSDDYFRLLGMPIVAGRGFDASRDTLDAEPVTVIDQAFATKYFPGRNPLGETFRTGMQANNPTYRVIGVVGNAKYSDLHDSFEPTSYLPFSQQKTVGQGTSFLLRTAIPASRIVPAATAAVTAANPTILVQYRLLESQIEDTLVGERLMATLSLSFGILAMVIATVGLYGVMSYMVARRRSEIGIRLALGAERGSVIGMVLREAMVLLAIGTVAGAGLAILAGRAVSSVLYGLKPWDPAALALSIGSVALVSLAASWIPARRAALVPPSVALREE